MAVKKGLGKGLDAMFGGSPKKTDAKKEDKAATENKSAVAGKSATESEPSTETKSSVESKSSTGSKSSKESKSSKTAGKTSTASVADAVNENGNGEIVLKINDVEPNKNQPRKNFNEDSLLELSESIKLHGIVQPLVVAKQKDYYEIIAGERRWRAAKMAGLKEVPVVIKDYTPQEIMEVALIENIQREDLNPVEEARAYQRLIREYDLKQDEVAEKVSKSRTAITNSLRLLKLDDRVLDMLVNETISSGHARALLGLADKDEQYRVANEVFDGKLSVRETEKLVKKINSPVKKQEKKELKNDFVYRDLEEKLKQKIGTKVRINRKTEQKGKIEIEYYSPEELEKILNYFN